MIKEKYFQEIEKKLNAAYTLATAARKKGYDPEDKVDIPVARDMSERVEGLVSVVAPQIVGSGISKRIKELEKKYGALDWRISLVIAEEIAKQKFCKFGSEKEAMEIGIRVGFAYHTLGTVASPLEGFTGMDIKKRRDGKEYFCLKYSGPIRSAGGTGASVSVLIADHVRKTMGYDVYDPTEEETQRIVTELYDYHERVNNLQYLPTEEEIKFLVMNLPVEIGGEPSEKIEVSKYKDLKRIETNQIRNGVCLVLGECLAQKAPKIWKQISKWEGEFDFSHWAFIQSFIELQKEKKAKQTVAGKEISPDYTYINDLVAGRPVLTYPLRIGGFRLRYGRNRVSGYSSTSISPLTMHALARYIATGTQLKLERPGKATVVTPCDTIEGPIVKLEDGSVARLNKQNLRDYVERIEEILFLGDLLVNYGDFLNRAHPLVEPGYCEEWWVQELEKAMVDSFGTLDFDKLSDLVEHPKTELKTLVENPLVKFPDAKLALNISEKLKIPLHPLYTYYWKTITTNDFYYLLEWLKKATVSKKEEEIDKIILPLDDSKRTLELLGVPHLLVSNEFVVIEREDAIAFLGTLSIRDNQELLNHLDYVRKNLERNPLDIINEISSVKVRDKAGVFIGARMGRPEKAKMRKLVGSPQVLFPVGEQGGRLRCFQAALEEGKVKADFPLYFCKKCARASIYSICEECGKKTKKRFYCPVCGDIDTEECKHGRAETFKTTEIDIKHYFESALKKLKTKDFPELIKGVRGTSNKDHVPENLVKGILRAKNEIYVNKDGTTRYDMTQIPITHFKPKEIRTAVEKLKELGYEKDIHGAPLEKEDQLLELMPQDVILPSCLESKDSRANRVLFKVSKFVDELLEKFYGLKPFYCLKSEQELVGHLILALAPHTSAAIVGRIIGFSGTQGFLAHPLLHAATRRDCLGYGAYVPIEKDGSWQIVKIGNFIDGSNPTEKADNFGTLTKKTSNLHTFSNPGKRKVNDVTKHQPRKLLKISLEDGRCIELTENHKLYTKGKKEKRVNELKIGDKLTVSYKKNIPERDIENIFLPEIFQERDDVMIRDVRDYLIQLENVRKYKNFYYRDSFPIRLVKKILNRHNKTIKDLPPKARIAIKRNNVSLPITIPLTHELLKVIGLYIAEGFLRKKDSKKGFYQISIAGNQEIKNLIKGVFSSHFNLKPSEDHEDNVTYSSRIIYELFKNYLKTGDRAKNKRIPYLFLNLKKEKLASLLRGYFEGDGSVSFTDNRVTCDTISEGLKYDLSFVLSRFNIFTTFYEYEKEPGPLLKKFYVRKNRQIPKFKITKILVLSNFTKKFQKIGFISKKKNFILDKICQKNPRGMQIDSDENYVYPKIIQIEEIGEKESYCLNVASEHNFFANDILVHNCDGDEASCILLMDALLNFSRQYLPAHRGATQDACLVLTYKLVPTEVDDMIFDLDTVWRYPLEFYQACIDGKNPWEVDIETYRKKTKTQNAYDEIGFTHDTKDINAGVRCSSYKLIPTMEEKLRGQMELAEKIRAVDQADVARLVIEKHFLKDTKGNLRKFSMQQFRCVKCNEKYRRPPLVGKCLNCGGRIIFTISEGSIVKYLEPSMSLAKKYDLPPYLRQSLELLQRRIESVFGKEKERQEGLGKWFG